MMAAQGALHVFLSRSAQADEIIRTLTSRLAALKQAKAAEWCSLEMEKLRRENSSLKEQVNKLVRDLSASEEQHGLMQVSLPNPSSQPPPIANAVHVSQPTSKASPATGSSAPDKSAATPREVQPAKEKKVPAKKSDGSATAAPPPKNGPAAEAPADCSRLLLKVGRVVSAARHPDADTLYVEEVDLAEDRLRTVVSGLVKHVSLEELQGRLGVFLCNLKPAKMRGVLSEAMIMCASTPDKVCIISPPSGAVPGDRVVFELHPGEPDEQLNPKKKTWEQVQPDLKTDETGVATYKGDPFVVRGKGVCTAHGCSNFPIK